MRHGDGFALMGNQPETMTQQERCNGELKSVRRDPLSTHLRWFCDPVGYGGKKLASFTFRQSFRNQPDRRSDGSCAQDLKIRISRVMRQYVSTTENGEEIA
jgi:hypothetical protein